MAHQDALVRLRHQIGMTGLVPGQQAALLQAGSGPGLTQSQLQALWQAQHPGIPLPSGILVPHTQEELELAHLQVQVGNLDFININTHQLNCQ